MWFSDPNILNDSKKRYILITLFWGRFSLMNSSSKSTFNLIKISSSDFYAL